MSAITDISRIAHIARIKFPEEAMHKLSSDIKNITEWLSEVKQVDASAFEPLQDIGTDTDRVYFYDTANSDTIRTAEIIANAKNTNHNFILVPKVIE